MEGVNGAFMNGGEGIPQEYINLSVVQYVPPGGGMFMQNQPMNSSQETYTAFFNPNTKPVQPPNPLPSGTFVAIVELGVIMHIHSNGTVCTNLIEHATLALQSDVQGARAARQTLDEYFQNKVLSRIRKLEDQNEDLEQQVEKYEQQLERVRHERKEAQQQSEELQARIIDMEKRSPPSNGGTASKRKSPDVKPIEPPAKRPATQHPSFNQPN
ncbi:hypothetical protein PM082_014972 [Marasmius tenuissimus]|nr:hypothetical protein PM082_014972 [Marasmius tenuissimus]